ncbi:hypothetical protein YC2023_072530 [Brassica napus]
MEIKIQEVGNVKEKCAEVMKSKEVEAAGSETILDADAEDKMDMTTRKNGNIMEVLEKTIVGSNKGSEGGKIWMDVSLGKASRTPAVTNKLKFDQVSILSKSRFSVLSLDEEEGEITENNEVEEVNKEVLEEVDSEERSEEQSDKEDLEKKSMKEDEVVRRQFCQEDPKLNINSFQMCLFRECGMMARAIRIRRRNP